MELRRIVMLLALVGVPMVGRPQALPVYTSPASKVGGALANGITQTLVRRGFAANDPRVIRTIASVGARVLPLASAAGSTATWLTVAAELAPVVITGVVVYAGVKWYFDSQGKAYPAPPGSSTASPVFSDGVKPGGTVYFLENKPYVLGGSVQEVVSAAEAATRSQYPDATYSNISISQVNSNRWTIQSTSNIPSIGIYNNTSTSYAQSKAYTGTVACPGGQVLQSDTGNCSGAQLDRSPWAGQPVVGKALVDAYGDLPMDAKNAPLSPALGAELANRVWKDAASQADYDGVPWSSVDPTTADDLQPSQTAHPDDWPKTSELTQTVPTTGPSPIAPTTTNPNQVTSPSTSTKVDLGPDPGTPAPTLEQPPTEIFKPISDLMRPFTSWSTPVHSAVCPTWSATPVIAGHALPIDLSSHCAIAEQYRATIMAAALACWAVVALFIVLSA